jgi:hypothetical protein
MRMQEPIEWPEAAEIVITEDAELELIRNLVRLPDILNEVERDLYPHKMCDYLFETSQKFNKVRTICRYSYYQPIRRLESLTYTCFSSSPYTSFMKSVP